MKLIVIVTEYPKATETFIYRDLLKFAEMGAEIELHHLAPFRSGTRLHAFAAPTRAWARYTPFVGLAAMGALARAVLRHPLRLARIVCEILLACRREPKLCLKSLALVPKALAMARRAGRVGADHVHAEFAGHPATVAWVMHRFGGPSYSVSCRAHDIFRTQSLLDRKLAEAAAVRTVSDFGRRFLRERVPALGGREIEVIHSSVDLDAVGAPPAAAQGQFRILFVGALEAKKGVEHLLSALALAGHRLGEWTCELVGEGPLRGELQRQAGELGIAGRVRFLGALDFDSVREAYGRASLCVAPSVIGPGGRQEGIPNVMIEALAFERPAISTRISGIPELIQSGVNGLLVPPGDSQALAEAILQIRSDPTSAAAMAARGRETVARHFDLAVNARRQLRMFEACVTPTAALPQPQPAQAMSA
ncbi:MAG TPA: glycosyltransferase family 4 protein [Allosphingosinicella sp.]|jgi:glycosyltransferase involved in cell wall biosynthesis